MATKTAQGCTWIQKVVQLKARSRGCHYITDELCKAVPEMNDISIGIMHLCIQHTSASLTLQENYDPDVLVDMEMMLNRIVPEKAPYKHTAEGADDMPAHVKAALMGPSLSIHIHNGHLQLGTWQGLWLCEHRNNGGARKVSVTIQGAPA